MVKRTKTALVTGAAVLALAGIGGGVAYAATDTGTSTPTLAASTSPSTSPATPKPKAHPLRSRVEHGQLTVRVKTGTKVVDVQRGQVTAVTPTSVTVRSQDGFSATYAVNSTSKIHKNKQTAAISGVVVGDRVRLAATHAGSTDTVLRLADAGPAKH
jgi:hypothetical protein